jgi:hypothetical protein
MCNSLMSKDFLHIIWTRGSACSDRPTHEKLRVLRYQAVRFAMTSPIAVALMEVTAR